MVQCIFGTLLHGTFYFFLTWMEPLGKSKVKIGKLDLNIDKCWGTPSMVSLWSYFHWYLEVDQVSCSRLWGSSILNRLMQIHPKAPRNLAHARSVKVTEFQAKTAFFNRGIWVEFSFSKNLASKQYHYMPGNVLAANNTIDSVGSSWLMFSNT